MYNQKVKALVSKYEKLEVLYNIGPVQKCMFEDFVDEVLKEVASKFELPEYQNFVMKAFDD